MNIEPANYRFVLISHGDNGDPAQVDLFATAAERDAATLSAINPDMDSESAQKYLDEARTNGRICFEGDPSLEWICVHDLVRKVMVVARAAHELADGTECSGPSLTVPAAEFDALSAALDGLDELPEMPELLIGTGPAKAEYWLTRILGINPEPLTSE